MSCQKHLLGITLVFAKHSQRISHRRNQRSLFYFMLFKISNLAPFSVEIYICEIVDNYLIILRNAFILLLLYNQYMVICTRIIVCSERSEAVIWIFILHLFISSSSIYVITISINDLPPSCSLRLDASLSNSACCSLKNSSQHGLTSRFRKFFPRNWFLSDRKSCR